MSAQVRTETAGAHSHLYRQHSTQLQQLQKGCKANWLYACQSKPLAEMLSFRISIGLAVSSAAVEARGIPFSYKCRFHISVISPCCSVALSVSRRSAVVVALSLATKRVSCSTAACQHQTCLFAWQQPLIISRTGWQQEIRQSFAKQHCDQSVDPEWHMGRICFGGRSPIAFLVSTSVHAVQDLEGRPNLLQRRRRKKRRKRRSQSRANQAMKWPLKHGQNGPNGKPIFGMLIATSG